MWLEDGENNTNFFHWFASRCKLSNSIWEIKKSQGELMSRDKALKSLTINLFQVSFAKPLSSSLLIQLKGIKHFPHLLWEDSCTKNGDQITLEEVKNTFLHFPKDKSPSLMCGWLNFSCPFSTWWLVIFWILWNNLGGKVCYYVS